MIKLMKNGIFGGEHGMSVKSLYHLFFKKYTNIFNLNTDMKES